jgi:hypothetical protein
VHTQRERRNKPNIRQSELSHIKLLLILILKYYLKKEGQLFFLCITKEHLSYIQRSLEAGFSNTA